MASSRDSYESEATIDLKSNTRPAPTRSLSAQIVHRLRWPNWVRRIISSEWTSNAKDVAWYKPEIGPRLRPLTRKFYETYIGLTDDELVVHLHNIRDGAWPYGRCPCIGDWSFLLPIITTFPIYPSMLQRARAGATILDLGCGLGQELRRLVANGVPTDNMYATDLSRKLWDLGFALFRDQERMKARFIQANILSDVSGLDELEEKVDIVLACQTLRFFHWFHQTNVLKRIVQLSTVGTVVGGYQIGMKTPRESFGGPWEQGEFYHSEGSFNAMWNDVQSFTKTKWKVEAKAVDLREWGMEKEDFDWMADGSIGINFVVTREA